MLRKSSASSSAGAIFVWEGFTQPGGTLTITNASAPRGGVVDFGVPQGGIWRCCLRLFEVAPRAVLRFIRSRFQGFTCCV